MSRDLQVLFAAVAHLDEGLKSWDITRIKGEKVPNLLSGYMETNSVHNRTKVNFVLENVNKTQSTRMLSSGIKCSEI
jgi:hypothetical protein